MKVKPFVSHQIEFQLDGYQNLTKKFKGSLASQKVLTVQLIASKRFINVSPRAGRVFINDRRVGMAERLELPPLDALGQIEIKVEATGYKTWTRTYPTGNAVFHIIKARLQEK